MIFFASFIKLITYSAPVLFKMPTPSQINLIKNAKNHFLLVKKFKKTGSAQLCMCGVCGVCVCVCVCVTARSSERHGINGLRAQSWALAVFFIFSNNKKWFFSFFIQSITLLLQKIPQVPSSESELFPSADEIKI